MTKKHLLHCIQSDAYKELNGLCAAREMVILKLRLKNRWSLPFPLYSLIAGATTSIYLVVIKALKLRLGWENKYLYPDHRSSAPGETGNKRDRLRPTARS